MKNVWSLIVVSFSLLAFGISIHTRISLHDEVEKAVSQRESEIVEQVRRQVNLARVELGLPQTEAKNLADVVNALIEPFIELGP